MRRPRSDELASTAATRLGEAIDVAISPPARELVACYFDVSRPFAAATFDTLGYNDSYRVGPDDLLAVTLLDVSIPALALRTILGEDNEHISDLLSAIPIGTDLWKASAAHLDAANELWQHLVNYDGVAWVTAGKLLARKRPRLIPIVDSVILRHLPAPEAQWWATLKACLDRKRVGRIEDLRQGVSTRVSTLRLLDVAVWMRYSDGRNARQAQKEVGLDVTPRPPRKRRSS